METLLPGITAQRVPTSRLTTAVLSAGGGPGPAVLFASCSPISPAPDHAQRLGQAPLPVRKKRTSVIAGPGSAGCPHVSWRGGRQQRAGEQGTIHSHLAAARQAEAFGCSIIG